MTALLTMIKLPRRIDIGQTGRSSHPNLRELIVLFPARLDLRSIEFMDRFDTVADDDPISDPAFIVDTLCRLCIDGRICSCDARGLRDGGTLDQ